MIVSGSSLMLAAVSCDYDANGNLVVRHQGQGSAEQALYWDAANRLAQVVGGSREERYLYAEDGRRLRQAMNANVKVTQ